MFFPQIPSISFPFHGIGRAYLEMLQQMVKLIKLFGVRRQRSSTWKDEHRTSLAGVCAEGHSLRREELGQGEPAVVSRAPWPKSRAPEGRTGSVANLSKAQLAINHNNPPAPNTTTSKCSVTSPWDKNKSTPMDGGDDKCAVALRPLGEGCKFVSSEDQQQADHAISNH
ncbi:hypothetical protein MUK42_12021 [Musa troglodytarum]|uniref:Uncharacterized protein n=1 Tax=Musa troglodytarum TaxID=320322 RepID=A0A9E7FNI7_9LILI|nr:hypothetical protein MUK42_12021 [Musa troglodytarum]